jgi:hypothetical protein
MKFFLSKAVCAFVASAAFAQSPEADVVSIEFDIEGFSRETPDFDFVPAFAPLAASLGKLNLVARSWVDYAWADESDVVEAARSVLGAEASVEAVGSLLRIRGSRADVDKAAAFYADLRAAAFPDSTVTIVVVDRPPEKATMTPSEAAAFFKTSRPRFEARTKTRGASGVFLRSGREYAFVSSYEVEIAEKVSIADAVLTYVPLGLTARVSAAGLPDGRFLLRVGGVFSSLQSVVDVPAGAATKFGDVQLPKIACSAVSGAAVVEDGGAFALGSGPGGYWVARLVRNRAPKGKAATYASDCSAAIRDGGWLPTHAVMQVGDLRGTRADVSARDDATAPLRPDYFLVLLRERARTAAGSASTTRGGGLLLEGDEAARRELLDAAAALCSETVRVSTIEARYGSVDASTAAAIVANEVGVEKLPGRATAVVPTGERFRLLDGIESTVFADDNVEIASEVSIAQSECKTTFEGVLFEGVGTVDATGTGYANASFLRRVSPEGTGRAPRLPNGVVIEPPNDEEIRFEGPITSRGEWTCLGTSTAHDGVFVVMVRMTR